MKKLTLFILFFFSGLALAQSQVVESFNEPSDSSYWLYRMADNSDPSIAHVNLSYETDNTINGQAVRVDWAAQNSEVWGGYVKFEHILPGDQVYDFSAYDSISFWYYNEVPQSLAGRAHVRFELYDVSDVPDTVQDENSMEFYYSFEYNILDDSVGGWHKYTLPLLADPNFWSGEGFNRTGWAGVAGNDHLDKDKIKGFGIEFSISGAGEGDFSQGIVVFDQIELSGIAQNPIIFFNGMAVPSNVALSDPWGGNTFTVTDEDAYVPGTNSLKWDITSNDWATWSGANFTLNNIMNYEYLWSVDSVKFAIKAPADMGDLKLVFLDDDMDGDGEDLMFEAGYVLPASTMGYDGTWKEVKIPLTAFNRFDGGWNGTGTTPGEMDSTRIKEFRILLADGNSFGKTIYLDNIWTGSPTLDVIPPEPPTGVSVVAGSYQNLVTWIDVPNEEGEVYDVFASLNPITDLSSSDVDVVATGVEGGTQLATHVLIAPLTDQDLTYYYAVLCVDAAGNKSQLVTTDPITNTAKGVTTIYPEAPTGFAADGDLSEWSSIPSFRMYPSDGSGTIVNNTVIDGDADLSVDAYVAVDADYIYFAFNVEDDIVSSDTTLSSYLIDSPDLYLGLYDWRGAPHTGLQAGDEPDYHFRFNSNAARVDNIGGQIIMRPGANYYWAPKFPTGYIVEGKYSLDSLAAIRGDARFVPQVGMRIPIDYSINDADATGQREGILTYSINNQDQSWANVSRWTHTWVGDSMTGVNDGTDNVISKYELSQNYPNPFNPTTVINYSLQKTGMVSLSVYNILGQKVATLVNKVENAGVHNIKFNASNLTSGVYIYRIQAGSFTQSRKMILLK